MPRHPSPSLPWGAQVDPDAAIPLGVPASAVRSALRQAGGRAAAVLIVSPTYHGILSDIRAIAAECERAGVPLIVDEAHGAHLRFLPGAPGSSGGGTSDCGGSDTPATQAAAAPPSGVAAPPSGAAAAGTVGISATGAVRRCGALSAAPAAALDCGAHLVVHSVHKTLSSATQTGMLHASHASAAAFPRIDQALCRALDVLQSSSPSYLLLASLDAARSAWAHI